MWRCLKPYSTIFSGLVWPRIQFNFLSKEILGMLHSERRKPMYSKIHQCNKRTGGTYYFPHVHVCYVTLKHKTRKTRSTLRSQSKLMYTRQNFFPLLTSCQKPPRGNSHTFRKAYRHQSWSKGKGQLSSRASAAELLTMVQMEIRLE